jgi:hypothetical protein
MKSYWRLPERAEGLSQTYVLDTSALLNLIRGKELGEQIDRAFGLRSAMYRHTISIETHARHGHGSSLQPSSPEGTGQPVARHGSAGYDEVRFRDGVRVVVEEAWI